MSHLRRLILSLALAAGIAPAIAQVPAPVPALPDAERRISYSITASTCACSLGANLALYGDGTDYQNWVEVWLNGVRVNYNDATYGWAITSPSGSIGNIARPITDALLTFTNAQTGTVQIVGARRPRRVSQFSENAGVPARNINQTVTDIIATQRELWDKTNDMTGRGLFGLPGETLSSLPSATARASKFLVFDSLGNPTVTAPSVGTGNVVGPASSTVGHIATYNSTTGTLLADVPPPCSDLSNAAPSCSTDTTNATNITSGTLAPARGGNGADNSTNSANDVLASNGANGNFVHTALLTVINTVCTLSPSSCNALFGYYNIFWFGFSCTGASEANILQTAVTALPSNGGVIFIPGGANCNDSGTVTITKNNVRITGAERATGNSSGPGGVQNISAINYSGTAARYIDARSISNFTFEKIQLTYSAAFTGSLIDCSSNNPGVTVGSFCGVRDNFIGTNTGRTGAATLVNLGYTVDSDIQRNFFYHGAPAILGELTAGQNTVAFIHKNVFSLGDSVSISSCGEAWTVDQNSFEPTSAGQGQAFSNISTLRCKGMVWTNNWFGDVTVTGGTWVSGFFDGVTFSGNQVSAESTGGTSIGFALNTSTGVTFIGNRFQFLNTAINCNTASANGVVVQGNSFGGVSAIGNSANCTNLVNSGNAP
jgi:hypothetical protein